MIVEFSLADDPDNDLVISCVQSVTIYPDCYVLHFFDPTVDDTSIDRSDCELTFFQEMTLYGR